MIQRISTDTATIDLAGKARLQVDTLAADLLQDTTLGQSDALLQRLYAGLGGLLDSLGTPALRYRPFVVGQLPIVEDYNDSLQEAITDIGVIFDSADALGRQTIDLHNVAQAEVSRLGDVAAQVQAAVEAAEGAAYTDPAGYFTHPNEIYRYSQEQVTSFLESFTVLDDLDLDQSSVAIDTDRGVVTLAQDGAQALMEDATVSLRQQLQEQRSANGLQLVPTGLPGNNLELAGSALGVALSNQTPSVELVADTDPHNVLQSVLDDAPQTWFEYERCDLLANPAPLTKSGSAWVWVDGAPSMDFYQAIYPDTWQIRTQVTETGDIVTMAAVGTPASDLTITVTITFPDSRVVNSLEIAPCLFDRGRRHFFSVASIQLLDDKGSSVGEALGAALLVDKPRLVHLPPTRASAVYYRMVQHSKPYQTLLGHYFVEATATTTTTKSSSGFLGLFGHSSTGSTVKTQRVATTTDAYALQTSSGSAHSYLFGLFSSSKSSSTELSNLTAGYDVVKGLRWAIGLQDLGIYRSQYKATGELITKALTFPQPPTALWLNVWDSTTVALQQTPVAVTVGQQATPVLAAPQDAGTQLPTDAQPTTRANTFGTTGGFLWGRGSKGLHVLGSGIGVATETPVTTFTMGAVQPLNDPIAPTLILEGAQMQATTRIRYYLSVAGADWAEILPYGSGQQTNPEGALISDTLQVPGVPAGTPVPVRVRAVLTRDDSGADAAGYTPILYGFQLVGATLAEKFT